MAFSSLKVLKDIKLLKASHAQNSAKSLVFYVKSELRLRLRWVWNPPPPPPSGRSESPSDVKGAGRGELSLLPAVQRHLPSLARQAPFAA